MDCPICPKTAMITLELDDVEIDYCMKCGGIWLDGGELEQLFENPADAGALLDRVVSAKARDHGEESYKCPICDKKMDKVYIGENEGKVLIDACPRRDGLWFDKGELGSILGMSAGPREQRVKKLLADMFRMHSES